MNISLKKIISKFTSLWQYSAKTGQQLVRGSILIIFSRVSIKLVQFFRTVIIARLLFPEDVGLFGLAALALATIDIFFQTGFSSALIHEKNDIKKYLNTAWTVGLIRNAFVAALLFFVGAPLAGTFFQNPSVVPMVKVIAFALLILGFENIGIILFQKELRFNKKFFYDVTVVISEVTFVVIGAVIYKSAWVLVLGVVVNRLSVVISSYVFHPYRPSLSWDWTVVSHLLKYGKWVGLASIITFFSKQGDYLMIGHLLEPKHLGIYQVAFALGTLPAVEIARVFSNISFPLFAKIQQDTLKLKLAFISLFRVIFAVIIPALAGIFILSEEIIHFVYGEPWLAAVPIVKVIVFVALLKSFESVVNPLFMGIGKPKFTTLLSFLQSIVMFTLVLVLTKQYGVVGVAWSVFAGLAVSQLISFIKLRQEVALGVRGFASIVSLPLVSSCLMMFLIYYLKSVLPVNNFFILSLYIIFGIIIYFILIFYLDRFFGKKYSQALNWVKKSL